MKRSPLRARPKRSGNDPVLSRAWWEQVTSTRKCVVCKKSYPLHAHHVLSQQAIRKAFPRGHADGRSLQELLWDVSNGVAVCEWHHMQHEAGTQRLPAQVIPLAAFRFAESLGLGHRVGPVIYPR